MPDTYVNLKAEKNHGSSLLDSPEFTCSREYEYLPNIVDQQLVMVLNVQVNVASWLLNFAHFEIYASKDVHEEDLHV